MAITTDQIHAAAEALAARGESPTLAAVRRELGGGSFTTISEAMQSWRRRQQAVEAAKVPPIPEIIQGQGRELLAALWQAAREAAEARLDIERQALEQDRQVLVGEAREAARTADELEASQQNLQQQAARIVELEGRLQTEVERRQEAEQAVQERQHRLGQAEAHIQRLAARLEAAQEQAEREAKTTARAHQQTAQERDQAREGQHQAEALVGELRVKVARLETERAALQRSLERADRQLEGLMERLGPAGQPERQAKAKPTAGRARRSKKDDPKEA